MKELVYKVTRWHHDRNLIWGATDKDQVCKLIQEVGELSDNVCKGNDIKDDIGDCMVVLINIAERNGTNLEECLLHAWDDIKDRKGRMVDGIFVKESDNEEVVYKYKGKPTTVGNESRAPSRTVTGKTKY